MTAVARVGTLFLLGCSSTLIVGEGTGDGGSGRLDGGPPAPRDAAPPPETDQGTLDLGAPPPCAFQDARPAACGPGCDEPERWYYGPDGCQPVGCACVGSDCTGGFAGRAACQEAFAACPPVRCRVGGGTWRAELRYCGDFECGVAPLEECLTPTPACDCGPEGRFDGERCVPGRCEALRGEPLCAATGGVWTEGICCPTSCGEPCLADCAAPACECGPESLWDDALGCRYERACERGPRCDETRGDLDCAPGEVCCASGGCQAPMCGRSRDARGCPPR